MTDQARKTSSQAAPKVGSGTNQTRGSNNSQRAPNTSNNASSQPQQGLQPPQKRISQSSSTHTLTGQPSLARRSSFGLNFLSNFRSSNQDMQFMSNSPTIANLSSYTDREETFSESASTNNQNHQASHTTMGTANHSTIPSTFNTTPIIGTSSVPAPITQNNEPTAMRTNPSQPPETGSVTGNPTRDATPLSTNDEVNEASSSSKNADSLVDKDGLYSVRLTPLIDHSSSTSGLYFQPIIRKIKALTPITIGRYTEKNKAAAHAPQGSSAPVVFKSKVVSRTHALFQCNEDGQWFLKDCKSSSGTFLNHVRLSSASEESNLMPLLDGDIIQLGMDYRGGTEEVYRCVKMRCEFNRSWQRKVNQFNLEIHKKLKNLQISGDEPSAVPEAVPANISTNDMTECAICLMGIEPCQALFISPCSHAWHYKCIRPLIIKSYPQFYCPNCRTMCDLETDLDDDE